jgi:hypothetical protein
MEISSVLPLSVYRCRHHRRRLFRNDDDDDEDDDDDDDDDDNDEFSECRTNARLMAGIDTV